MMAKNATGQLEAKHDIDEDDEYDTDIEDKGSQRTLCDQWGRNVYRTVCRKIGIQPQTRVFRALKKNAVIMNSQCLRWKDILALSICLLENVTVTVLSLDNNEIDSRGASYIASVVSENHNIKHLSLANNDIGNDGMRFLVDSLKLNRSLIRCNVSGNHLNDDVADDLAELIKCSKTLIDLNLSHNHFTEDGARIIGNAIAENDYLKYFDISWNKIRPKWMVHIFNGVQNNAALKNLNVSMNGVDAVGAKACAEMLIKNRSLVELDLTITRISDTGMGLIAKALATNDTLQILRLPGNPVTASGAAVLIDFLKQNDSSAINYIDLSTTHVLQDFIDDIEEVKEFLPTIRIDVGGIVSTYHTVDASKGDKYRNKNPLTLLRWYVAAKNMRLIDLFRQLDKDNSMSVSREEFLDGLKSINIPLSAEQMERLMAMLDKDGDGEVDYSELAQGDKENRKQMRKQMTKNVQEQKAAAQDLWGAQENRKRGSVQFDSAPTGRRDTVTIVPNRKVSTVIPPKLIQE